jgi:hypothetical protein
MNLFGCVGRDLERQVVVGFKTYSWNSAGEAEKTPVKKLKSL